MSLSRVASRAALVVLAVALPTSVLAAQDKSESSEITWEIGSPKAGWCLHFLVEVKDAGKDLPRGRRLVLARDAAGLPDPIQRLIRDEPKYADWVPNQVCTYMAEAVWLEGRRYDNGEHGQPLSLVYWGVSAAGSGTGVDTNAMALRILAVNNGNLERAMAIRSVPIDGVKVEVSPVKESDDLQYLVKLEGATMLFVGHQSPDSALARADEQVTAAYQGHNNTIWGVSLRFRPQAVQGMAGSLRILGRHGLAKLLIRSPIRMIGPVLSGGRGEAHFIH
jgi:hypothetical protein